MKPIESYVSHMSDKEKTLLFLAGNHTSELKTLVLEFAHKFNVRVGVDVRNNKEHAHVYSEQGYPLGRLDVESDSKGKYYAYRSPFVTKERSSSRGGRDTREAKSIPLLLRSCHKYADIPSYTRLIDRIASDAKNAIAPLNANEKTIIHIGSESATDLLRAYMGEKLSSDEVLDVQRLWGEYTKRKSKSEENLSILNRFVKGGFTLITSIRQRYSESKETLVYMISDATRAPGSKTELALSNIRYVNSLYEAPDLLSDVTILSTYFKTQRESSNDNELNISHCDKYFPEIDVCVGYGSREMLHVAIPKLHE